MKNGFILGITAAFGISFALFAGYELGLFEKLMRDRITNLSYECLEIHRDDFKDPRSAYVEDAWFADDSDQNKLSVNVKAKNSFGAYGDVIIRCSVIGDRVSRDWEAEIERLRQ